MMDLNMPIMAFIELNPGISNTEIQNLEGLDKAELLWRKIKNRFYGPNRRTLFEDSVLLDFIASGDDNRAILKEFLFLLKSFCEVKLLHLK